MKVLSNKELSRVLPEITKKYLNDDVIKIKFIGGGSFGKVFKASLKCGKVVVLKVYRVKCMNETEAEQLRLLSKNTVVPMPQVYFTHNEPQLQVMCMSFIEGENALNPLFLFKSKNKKNAFSEAVINGMIELHSVTNDKFGDINCPKYESWLEYYEENILKPKLYGLNELVKEGKYSKKKYNALLKATEFFRANIEEPEKAHLIHGDLNIMNIMVDKKSMALKGFIDPLNTMWADREYDLFQLLNMWGNSFLLYDTYKAKNDMSKYSDFKVAFYGAINEAGCLLTSGLHFPLWEALCFNRLKKEMKKLKICF